jgi:peptidoglycan/xylan/chitin deacetylase (PgdA/CDA1 family)
MGRLLCLFALFQFIVVTQVATAQEPYITNGLNALAEGDLVRATQETRKALELAPDAHTSQALLGTLALYAGEPRHAQAAFERLVTHRGFKGLALYGLALSRCMQGDTQGAQANLAFSAREAEGRSEIGLAQAYIRMLAGAKPNLPQGELAPAPLTGYQALVGMGMLTKKQEAKAGRELLLQALKPPQNTLLRQSWGVLMTFEVKTPLQTGYRALPAGMLPNLPTSDSEALRGEVFLTPKEPSASVAYVQYEVDGRSIGLVSTRPFQIVWRSNEVANGYHDLVITYINSSGAELRKTTQRIRVLNSETRPPSDAEIARLNALQERFWNLLTLQPERSTVSGAYANSLLEAGEKKEAQKWLWRAAAIRPNLPILREKLLPALGRGNDAMYGGLQTEKLVALTFDDGPKSGITEALLEMLVEAKAPSTFFVIGRHVTANPELTRKIVDAGMEIANHSYTHRNLAKLAPSDLEREIVETQAVVLLATGNLPHYLRPPGGNWSDGVERIARQWGLTPGFWTVDVYGSEVLSAQEVVKSVLEQVRPGSVVLMHNGRVNTLQALPTILRELRQRGYTFVTMETLEKRLHQANRSAQERVRAEGERRRRRGE